MNKCPHCEEWLSEFDLHTCASRHYWRYIEEEALYECCYCREKDNRTAAEIYFDRKDPCPGNSIYERNRADMERKPRADRRGAVTESPEGKRSQGQEKSRDEAVHHPSHYTSGAVECIDAIEAVVSQMTGGRALLTGQVMKYMWRWDKKGGVQDLEKAKWYLERLIKNEKDKSEGIRLNPRS